MRVLLTGAQGMLGQEIVRVFSVAGHEVLETDRGVLDITNQEAVLRFADEQRPDVIINTAAYNFVDKVEDSAVYPVAFAVNAVGPRNLAQAAKALDIPFVHFSTDYVFAGNKPEGYIETDEPSPISKYGETKAEGERMVKEVNGKIYICRLSKLFGKPGAGEGSKPSFVALMLRLAAEKPELKIVNEEVGCPTYAPHLAEATLALLEGEYAPGVYHMVNDGTPVTWYEFAQEIFTLAHVSTPRHPVLSSEFPRAAKAPKFAALLNTAFPKLPSRADALKDFISQV